MARPKSEDRRAALLDAAAAVFAENGLVAPTASISARAKVSEGSFFTYFKTKDELINELYRDLRNQLWDSIREGFPHRAAPKERLEHVFGRYVDWGAAHPTQRKALRMVALSPVITAEVKAEAGLFVEVDKIKADAAKDKKLAPTIPSEMQTLLMKQLAEMTMDLMAAQPERASEFRAAGFQMYWAALTSKP